MGDKWTLLIIRDLVPGPRRFVELQRVLPGISTEQLRSRLNRMVADGLLTRERFREVPPRVEYELTDRARSLVPVLGALARWGYEWTWTSPRSKEQVDIGAILRLAPGIINPEDHAETTVECIVQGTSGAPDRSYIINVERRRVSVTEQLEQSNNADAVVRGKQTQWVKALSPDGSLSGLNISGKKSAADGLLRRFIPKGSKKNAKVPA